MSDAPAKPISISVSILDKSYVVACPPQEKEALLNSARLLDERMREVRDSGKVLGTERMAVITALNVIHELNQQKLTQNELSSSAAQELKRLEDKIAIAVGRRQPIPAVD
ncbi:MAG: cell division protein ZapA [Gammaproteobacteria bacterium]